MCLSAPPLCRRRLRRMCRTGGSPTGRGLHSSTSQLTVSAFCGTGGAFGVCFRGVDEVSGDIKGSLGCVFVSGTAQVELKIGRV